VLVLDAGAPWGSGACPPLGDLRARPEDLLGAADVVAVLGASLPPSLGSQATLVPAELTGAVAADGSVCTLASLHAARVGLVTGIARPERVLASLEAAGIAPVARVLAADHARFADVDRLVSRLPSVDAWLTTTRCATKLPSSLRGAPVLALARRLDTADLVRALSARLGRGERDAEMEPSKTAEPLC
jgi:tetraacyldisaccharide 4'-kinase